MKHKSLVLLLLPLACTGILLALFWHDRSRVQLLHLAGSWSAPATTLVSNSTAVKGSTQQVHPQPVHASASPSYHNAQQKHQRDQGIPGTRHYNDTSAHHCQVTKGSWCGEYWTQHLLPALPPPRHDKPCPEDCSGAGWCNHATGTCVCQAGWQGPACKERQDRWCYNSDSNGRDLNLTTGSWVHTRCSGICDPDIGMCYCPPDTKYGHRVDPEAQPGSKPLQQGRPMYWCNPNTTADGMRVPWTWNIHKYEDVLGPDGWCNSNNSKAPCGCTLDGLRGALCDIQVDQFCPNQCGGNGDCILGFCKCHAGWYGHDCALRKKGLHFTPAQLTERLQRVVRQVPAAVDPPIRQHRKCPYIYVYEMDPIYNAKMLQYRLEGFICINRFFDDQNQPQFVGYSAYSLETVFHELMLTSEHRTFNPEEADYFYVPLYISCLADMVGKSPAPFWPRDEDGSGKWGDRPYRMSMMALDAKRWLQHNFPYWNRSGGTDHIWLFTHDEAPCYQHKELWPSIWLSHWGRLDFPHGSNSSYGADNYSVEKQHSSVPQGFLHDSSKAHPCYDAKRHLVVPVFKQPQHYRHSPYLGHPPQTRDILFFFRGDLGLTRPGCVYSRCIRQTIWKHYKEGNWREKYNVLYGDHTEVQGDYGMLLARSKFCLVIPGDGWSARYEDAMTHGCVPVIIMDNTLGPFETLIDYTRFTIRVAERDVGSLVTILQSVSDEQLRELQQAGAHVWMRFRWNGTPLGEHLLAQVIQDNTQGNKQWGGPGTQWAQTADNDALSTIMQWLYHRLPAQKKLQQQTAAEVAA